MSQKRWHLFAETSTMRAMIEIVRENNQSSRSMLIEDIKARRWRSIEIPGTESRPKYISPYFVGTITHPSPSTNYDQRVFYSDTRPADTAFVLDPSTLELNKIYLGKNCEILWIDNDGSVFYKVLDSLFQAKYDGRDFADRKLILSNLRMHYINWAYRVPN